MNTDIEHSEWNWGISDKYPSNPNVIWRASNENFFPELDVEPEHPCTGYDYDAEIAVIDIASPDKDLMTASKLMSLAERDGYPNCMPFDRESLRKCEANGEAPVFFGYRIDPSVIVAFKLAWIFNEDPGSDRIRTFRIVPATWVHRRKKEERKGIDCIMTWAIERWLRERSFNHAT